MGYLNIASQKLKNCEGFQYDLLDVSRQVAMPLDAF